MIILIYDAGSLDLNTCQPFCIDKVDAVLSVKSHIVHL